MQELPPGTVAVPPPALGSGLGHTFTFRCSSGTFLGAFANGEEMLQGSAWVGNRSSGRGGFPLPERSGFVLGFAAGFVAAELQQFPFPLPSPDIFERFRGS